MTMPTIINVSISEDELPISNYFIGRLRIDATHIIHSVAQKYLYEKYPHIETWRNFDVIIQYNWGVDINPNPSKIILRFFFADDDEAIYFKMQL